jgi:hypothetical protein
MDLSSVIEGITDEVFPDGFNNFFNTNVPVIVKEVEKLFPDRGQGSNKKKASVFVLQKLYDLADSFLDIPDIADNVIKKIMIPALVEIVVAYFNVKGWNLVGDN